MISGIQLIGFLLTVLRFRAFGLGERRRLEERGQIEGIGPLARLSVEDLRGRKLD